MHSELRTCPNIQMWFNPRQLNDAMLSIPFLHTDNHVLSQLYKCGLAMLLRQLNASTIGA